jgi:hypothetical protein
MDNYQIYCGYLPNICVRKILVSVHWGMVMFSCNVPLLGNPLGKMEQCLMNRGILVVICKIVIGIVENVFCSGLQSHFTFREAPCILMSCIWLIVVEVEECTSIFCGAECEEFGNINNCRCWAWGSHRMVLLFEFNSGCFSQDG